MDGNYNAENVYFSNNLITTTPIGNINLVNGQAVIDAAGKNLKEVFETIFVQEKYPTAQDPDITLLWNNELTAYEVGSVIEPSYTAIFNGGSYTYGPATNIQASNWIVTDSNGQVLTTSQGNFNSLTITDNMIYSITATADYTEGAIPVTNLGNEYLDAQIAADTATASTNIPITGYRNTFYGVKNNFDNLTSFSIRELSATNCSLANGSNIQCDIPIGAKRVIFAYPADLNDLCSVQDVNGLGAEILSRFKRTVMDVEGANGYQSKSYKVYYIDYANANDVFNSYIFTIGEEG